MHIVSPISLLIRRIRRGIPLRRRLILLMLFARISIRLSLLRSSWLILLRRKHLVLHCSAPLHLTYQFYSRPLSILTDLATHSPPPYRVGAGAVWMWGGDACVAHGGATTRQSHCRCFGCGVGTLASPMVEQLS